MATDEAGRRRRQPLTSELRLAVVVEALVRFQADDHLPIEYDLLNEARRTPFNEPVQLEIVLANTQPSRLALM